LRRSAFSQLEARALIENYVAVTCTKLAFWGKDIDTHSKGFKAALEIGLMTPLPVPDDEGRRIIMIRPGQWHSCDRRSDERHTKSTGVWWVGQYYKNVLFLNE
ncbi:unnamed protein product, partial [Owenia fusiformis]